MTGYCARCGKPSKDLVVVAVKDSASGGGITIRWCRDCAGPPPRQFPGRRTS